MSDFKKFCRHFLEGLVSVFDIYPDTRSQTRGITAEELIADAWLSVGNSIRYVYHSVDADTLAGKKHVSLTSRSDLIATK